MHNGALTDGEWEPPPLMLEKDGAMSCSLCEVSLCRILKVFRMLVQFTFWGFRV